VGNIRVSVRTLPDGTKVRHHPPDKKHPDGMQSLVYDPQVSTLRNKLLAHHKDHEKADKELRGHHRRRIDAKKKAQRNKGLPAEKSPI